MKQKFLIGLILLGCSSFLCADTPKFKSIEDIDKRIQQSQRYLDEIPAKLAEILEKSFTLEKEKKEVESEINRYLKTMDNCISSRLDKVSEQLCSKLANSDYGDRLKKKKKNIQEALELTNKEKERIEAEIQDIPIIQKGIQALKEVKEVLSLEL